jgi:hypothetical protein
MSENPFAPPPQGTRPNPGYPAQPWIPQQPQPQGQWVYVPPAPPTRSTNGFAIASMVLGIVWVFYLGSILALVFGYIALSQIKGNPQQGGRGMAVAGVVLGWIGVSILALTILLAAIGSI